MQKKHLITAGIVAIALLTVTATASALITRENSTDDAVKPVAAKTVSTVREERVVKNTTQPAPQPQQAPAPACDDGNIAGTVLGGAAGGVIGSQIGDGSGQTAATIAGVAGGALLGREYIPTRNITCR